MTAQRAASDSRPRSGGIAIAIATVVVLAATAGILLAISSDLPDPVATHWGIDATADGFTALDSLWTLIALPVVLAVMMLPVAFLARRLPAGVHWLAGLPVGLSLGIGTIVVGSLLPQRGLADAATATFPGWIIPLGVVLGIGGTIAASRLAPMPSVGTTTSAAPSSAVRATLPAGALVLWHGTTPAAPALTWIAAGLAVLGIAMSWAVSWWLLAVFVPLAVLLVASTQFDVTIGPAGVRASAALVGWPRTEAPLDTITSASATSTRFMDFGGWGIRVNPGMSEMGVITRFGPALRIERTGGAALVISMAEPEVPAGVLNTLLDRRSPETPAADGAAGTDPAGEADASTTPAAHDGHTPSTPDSEQ